MPTPSTPSVAISYSWSEEESGSNAGVVDQFCEALKSAGVPFRRDLRELKLGADIRCFMQSIGAADFLCVFLSDNYLRSKNCMYELLVAWQRSRDDADDFRRRVKVWIMPGMSPIHQVGTRISWLEHWKNEFREVEPDLKEHAASRLSTDTIAEIRRIGEIADNVEAILAFVANTLSPRDAAEYQAWIRQEFPQAGGTDDQDLTVVFERTASDIERIVTDNSVVRDFLRANTRGLVVQTASGWQLDPSVRRREYDVCPHLKAMREALPRLMGASRSDFDDLEQIIGGIVVMAIDPAWVLQQRDAMKSGSTVFPGVGDTVPVGEGVNANFLHVVASALADGHARLHKVFGDLPPAGDERCVPSPAMESGAVLADESDSALKMHFIRYILGPDVSVDPSNPEDVERRFKQVRDIVSFALAEDRAPFWGGGAAFQKLSGTIRKNLQFSDFLLIFPTGSDSEDVILARSIFVLKHLHHIFAAIKARRAALHV